MIEIVSEQNLVNVCKKVTENDSDLAFIFQTYGTPPMWARAEGFATLVLIILEQQVSVASAKAAFEKLRERVSEVTPEGVLSLTDEELRAAYFSRQKIIYARELASAILEKRLRLDKLRRLTDEEIRAELVKIKGIGRWTADIYLLMAMRRPDVMPRGDLALHVAWQRLKKLDTKPTADEFLLLAERWKPLRSVAARLLWHYYLNFRL